MINSITLSQLGWKPFFQQQLTLEEWEQCRVGRVVAQHRANIELLTEQGKQQLPIISSMPVVTTGDWVLLDDNGRFQRVLERLSLFSRKAAGSKIDVQLIAANIDTVFVVCSLNDDFNLNRIERYLALANGAGVEAVVVLTKSDCCDDPQVYLDQAQSLDALLTIIAVNGLDPISVKALQAWCGAGRTVAMLGSSGVGKSTLINTLLGINIQSTGSIREQDSKGRHTTTTRSLHLIPGGGLLLDTPGMRELQLADSEQSIAETFDEINEVAAQCRFSDCQHQAEPGCAVKAAIEVGELDERRLVNYRKLLREQSLNSASLAEKRAKARDLGRFYRAVQTESRRRKKG